MVRHRPTAAPTDAAAPAAPKHQHKHSTPAAADAWGLAELVTAPEDLVLEPGEPGPMAPRDGPTHPADVYRCAACERPECQTAAGCVKSTWRANPLDYVRKVLTARVYDVAVESPLELAPRLSERLGAALYLKREDAQPVFSFKLRGAFNKMARLDPAQRARGVICSSAGNHAQGVALAAKVLGCAATICMPTSTPAIKLAAVRRLGGTVDLAGESYSETQAHAIARAAAEGLAFVPPYDDPYTIAGQGTIGAEILRQLPASQGGGAWASSMDGSEDEAGGGGGHGSGLDAVFIAIGGGGLAAGVAAYIKALRPEVAVYGVEPAGANAMAQSLAAGRRVTLSRVDGFADGVAVKTVGAETFRLCRAHLDGVLTVSNAAISAAIKDVFNDTRSILEPAGAVAVAGAAAWLKKEAARREAAGEPSFAARRPTVVAIASGANMNFDTLRRVSELADAGGLEEATLATTIPERPGAFSAFIRTALEGSDSGAVVDTNDTAPAPPSPLAITELKYRTGGGSDAHVLWGAGVRSAAELEGVIARLGAAGFATVDLSGSDAAQVHLRHLVGGRGGVPLPDEAIYQVTFPERPGALRAFLAAVSPRWNVTLFHYRAAGTRDAAVLLGMQVPAADADAFAAATASLGADFAFEALDADARRVFAMFL